MRRKIITEFVYPPVPVRKWDWRATFDEYEPGDPIGEGETELESITDLFQQEKDRE